MELKILLPACFLCMCTCNNPQQLKSVKEEIVISDDKKKLEKIIDFSTMNPAKVQFVYAPMGKQDDRDLIPGPTDYKLEAVLYFKQDSRVNRQGCSPVEQNPFSRDDFNFSWLSEETKNELKEMSVDARGSNASCFYKGVLIHGSCFYLRDKILLFLYTN
jgi:hypothetical protein